MMEEPEENRLDHSLRDKFEDFNLPPDSRVWAGIETRLGRAPVPALRKRRRPVPVPLLFALTAILAGLLGWLLPRSNGPEIARTITATDKVASNASIAPSNNARTTNTSALIGSTISQAQLAIGSASPLRRLALARTRNQALLRHILEEKKTAERVDSRAIQVENLPVATVAVSTPTPETAAAKVPTSPTVGPVIMPEMALAPTAAATVAGASSESIPTALRTLVTLEREALTQLPSIATLAPGTPPAGSRAALLSTLRAERAELLRLQLRTDSTLLALGDLPAAPRPAVVATPVDTAHVRPLAHRWSLLLAATPEQNTLELQGPEGDSLTALRRNHETGRAGFNAAALAEYRLTPRLSVGGGVGYSTYGADLRLTTKNTLVSVKYDTTTTRTTSFYTSTNRTYSIRVVRVPQLSPVFNPNGQVIRYDTVYVPRQDTVYTTIVQRDNIHSIRRTVTPLISKQEVIISKLLQPTYRFFTVPVLLRYRLTTGPGRWWTDVAAGAQFQFFLGGTQVVTEDGENFRTESIRAGNGPFRPLNLALSGSLALNYALTNRLSVSVAPSMRWQSLSVYKTETGLRQQPTATGLMFGVRFRL